MGVVTFKGSLGGERLFACLTTSPSSPQCRGMWPWYMFRPDSRAMLMAQPGSWEGAVAVWEGSSGWGSASLASASSLCSVWLHIRCQISRRTQRWMDTLFCRRQLLFPNVLFGCPSICGWIRPWRGRVTCSRFKRTAVCVSLELFRDVGHTSAEEAGFHWRNVVVRGTVGLWAGS